MRYFSIIFFSFFTLFTAQSAQAKLNVVTTTTDLADIIRQVGGKHVNVESICKANQDPHFLQARPSLMVKLRKTNLIVSVGLEFEEAWLPLLIQGSRNPHIRRGAKGFLEFGPQIDAIGIPTSIDNSRGHVHVLGNPHFWLDPLRVERILGTVTQRLMHLDPKNAMAYKANAFAFGERIRQKMFEWENKLKPYKGTPIVSYHDTFSYFFARFGMESAGFLENRPGIPPTPRHLNETILRLKAMKVPVLFHERYHDIKASQFVAARTDVTLLVVPTSVGAVPEANDYIALIDTLVNQLVTAMEKRSE
jgi:zinc/manganese transport system substrate-binding protein